MKGIENNLMKECSFCHGTEYDLVIESGDPNICICNICIDTAYIALADQIISKSEEELKFKKNKTMKPQEIKHFFDQYIIGQEKSKKILSVGVYNHMLKILRNLDIQKSNILLIGPSGSGKTLFAKILSKILKVPFIIADATTLTEEGYVGDNIESMIQMLLLSCDFNIEKASKGIIYIDEIDKKAKKSSASTSLTRDVSGEGVQFGLLKMIEGSIMNIQPTGARKHPHGDRLIIDTSNILFIFGGAFNGLSEIISNRLCKNGIGFNSKMSKADRDIDLLNHLEQDDLIQYGLIPELVGRIPIISVLNKLSVDDLSRILTEPVDSIIKQYQILLKQDNINLTFTDSAIRKIAEIADKKGVGARGLKSVIESVMTDFQFEVERNEVEKNYEINEEMI
jgi:ATP-dependent Clp protease ATP-binding subunit ClpX